MNKTVAVIDVGSNSIKLLVARPGLTPKSIETVFNKTAESRISKGISEKVPFLAQESMEAGCRAIAELAKTAQSYQPKTIEVIATSAVRDAANSQEFIELVETATSLKMKVLSGIEEATFICKGLIYDPRLSGIENFIQMDIGGGSLELIRFARGTIDQVCSLQLGAVRLTEKFLGDQTAPLLLETETDIRDHVAKVLKASGFDFKPDSYPLIATGGAFAIIHTMLTAQRGKNTQETSQVLYKNEIIELKSKLVRLSLEERKKLPRLPTERADIIPAALITIIAVLDYASRDTVNHSFYNLRYGIAAELF